MHLLLPVGQVIAAPRVFSAPGLAIMLQKAVVPGSRVLIVDRNADAAVSLSLLIRQWGYETDIAHGCAEALASARSFQPDVIVCEPWMPGWDGFRLAADLRGAAPGAALVAVTVLDAEEYKRPFL